MPTRDLINFAELSSRNRLTYIDNRMKGVHVSVNVIPVTQEDAEAREDIKNKPVKDIVKEILQLIDQLPADTARVMEDDYKKNIKGKRKDVLIQFYHRIVEELVDNEDCNTTSEAEAVPEFVYEED